MSTGKLTRNTLMLYLRMIITTLISLYTSRIILEGLGIEDYGIYNIVGGTVVIVGFLSSAMSSATSRFLSISIANDHIEKTKSLFQTSTTLHLILAGIILFIGETLGLWFVNEILNVPRDRMFEVNVIYQLSVLSTCISIIQIPYDALIIAHEDISVFAILQIVNSVLKLGIALVILYVGSNKLIIYSILIFLVALLMRSIYASYSYKHYEECRFKITINKSYVKSLTSFTGWDLLGHLGFTARQQGSNIILNIFYGAAINASTGLAATIQGVTSTFSSNILIAARPQIIKLYSQNELTKFRRMVENISTLSLILNLAVALPVIININQILKIWLTEIPAWLPQFTICLMIAGLISSISQVYLVGIHATGYVKWSSLGRNITYISSIIVLYILLNQGCSPLTAYIILIFTQLITLFVDGIILRKAFTGKLQLRIIIRSISLCGLGLICAYLGIKLQIGTNPFFQIILSTLTYLTIFVLATFFFMLNKSQRTMILTKISKFRNEI